MHPKLLGDGELWQAQVAVESYLQQSVAVRRVEDRRLEGFNYSTYTQAQPLERLLAQTRRPFIYGCELAVRLDACSFKGPLMVGHILYLENTGPFWWVKHSYSSESFAWDCAKLPAN